MGLTQMPALDKRLNVTTESAGHIQEGKIELIPSYENIKPGSQRVAVALYNSSNDKITLKKGTIVAKVVAANVVLLSRNQLRRDWINCSNNWT